MHNLNPASRSHFFLPAFASQQAAMCTTLRAENIGDNWAHGVGQPAAVVSSSTINQEASHA